MNLFENKRDRLEQFVEEQLIGPGAYNKKYFFLDNWQESEFQGKNLKDMQPIHNITEIIPEVPAYQYGTGILFPETQIINSANSNDDQNNSPDEQNTTEHEQNGNTSADDDNLKEDTSENIVSKQQNYPNTTGLSFVVSEENALSKDLEVTIKFRKYNLINKSDSFSRNLSIWISENEKEVRHAVEIYFPEYFKTEYQDQNLFLSPLKRFSNEERYKIDYENLNQYFIKNVLPSIEEVFKNRIKMLKRKDGVEYYGTDEPEKNQFYSKSDLKNYGGFSFKDVYTLFEDTLIDFLKERFCQDSEEFKDYIELIQRIEVFKQLKIAVNDLKSIYRDNDSSPVWESKFYEKKIVLPDFDKKKEIQRFSPRPLDSHDENNKNLNYSLQYIRRTNQIFVKIILINKDFILLSENEPPQLNKKNEANLKAYFGIQILVEENTPSLLKYNPERLLEFDEEDDFNKLLYRNYKDLGEGYNTSVSWGEQKQLKYIKTDYLPAEETPKVDFEPSKIENGQISKRIKDEDCLSMHFLSTLSYANNSDIIKKLSSFVNEYKTWIYEQESILKDEKLNKKEILENQLKACYADYERLNRNILLLESNPAAMAAFRIMNTAMYMQLHHSISKERQVPFTPVINEEYENYYKAVGEKEKYNWRAFQLAFILLNIDGFVRPNDDNVVDNVFNIPWPERNEIADLVWFPTGGGKTEAYLGIIAFCIANRRFTKKEKSGGTSVLMRYTLRLLTLQQFQRATMLICALESIRKDNFSIPGNFDLGVERITVGLFVGGDSLPNHWDGDKSMKSELLQISEAIENSSDIKTKLPFDECPWCGNDLFIDSKLRNIDPNHESAGYGINDQISIACNAQDCTFYSKFPMPGECIPFYLFDEDIYKFPPTLLFGTVDKFANFANKVSTNTSQRNEDSRRLLGRGYNINFLPPELIIQDELHLLQGPLGSAVGLFEKSIDYLCSFKDNNSGDILKPKIITSTATTRNTDKQIFALFNRRSEIFPKQGINCNDSFFSFYERNPKNPNDYISYRKYIGVLPIGKTQVWMQLRIAAICLAHRLKFLREECSYQDIFGQTREYKRISQVMDYYHTLLSYFNSLKEVGKTQSQLSHYLPGDLNYIIENTTPWSFLDKVIRSNSNINYSELTGRLTGEQVKTNLKSIEKRWTIFSQEGKKMIPIRDRSPEFVISTNMISVGIDVSRFNTMIISSMPRNIAEYIQASSRVARKEKGIVFTVHHPFRSRDISHYQKFKEFHEKFYSYVEPISVTPFANKALKRYLPIMLTAIIRHKEELQLSNNRDANKLDETKIQHIKNEIKSCVESVLENAIKLEEYLKYREKGFKSTIEGIISEEEYNDLKIELENLMNIWLNRLIDNEDLKYRINQNDPISDGLLTNVNLDGNYWKVPYSLREIGETTVIKTVQQ